MKRVNEKKILSIVLIVFILAVAVVTSPKLIVSSLNLSVSLKNIDTSSILLIIFDLVVIISLAIILFLLLEQFETTSDIIKKEKKRAKKVKETLDLIPNLNEYELVKEVFYVYKQVERNRCNYNPEVLKKYVTEALFKNFEKEHELLVSNNHTRVISDIRMKNIRILKIKDNNKNYEILLRATIINKDYVKDSDDQFVLGNDLDLEYTYDFKVLKNKKVSEYKECPLCHHELEGNTSNKCPYCDGVILQDTSHIIMSEKKLVIEV